MSGKPLEIMISEVTIMCGNGFNGFNGGNCWWIIIILLLLFCCGNNGNQNIGCGCEHTCC